MFNWLGIEMNDNDTIKDRIINPNIPGLHWNLRLKQGLPVILVIGDTGVGKSAFCNALRLVL